MNNDLFEFLLEPENNWMYFEGELYRKNVCMYCDDSFPMESHNYVLDHIRTCIKRKMDEIIIPVIKYNGVKYFTLHSFSREMSESDFMEFEKNITETLADKKETIDNSRIIKEFPATMNDMTDDIDKSLIIYKFDNFAQFMVIDYLDRINDTKKYIFREMLYEL